MRTAYWPRYLRALLMAVATAIISPTAAAKRPGEPPPTRSERVKPHEEGRSVRQIRTSRDSTRKPVSIDSSVITNRGFAPVPIDVSRP